MSDPKFVVLDADLTEVGQDDTEAAAIKTARSFAEDTAYEPPFYVAKIVGKAERSGSTYTPLPAKAKTSARTKGVKP